MKGTLVSALLLAMTFTAKCEAQTSRRPSPSPTADVRYPTGAAPGSVETADFNGDGLVDIVVANEESNDVTILLGNGKGRFTPATGSPFAAGHAPNDVAVGDFNHDGKADLVFANHEERKLTLLWGNGEGGFKSAPYSPISVDVRPHTHGISTGDFNGDGRLDLVTENWARNQVAVLFGDADGNFSTPPKFVDVGKMPYQRVRAGDVNGDRLSDIITTNLEGDNTTVLLSDGNGGFKEAGGSPFACGDSPFNFAIGDLNKDGKPDLAIVNSPGSAARSGNDGLTILLGDGAGRFSRMKGSPFPVGKTPNRVAIGDVDGDGVADVAVSSPESNSVTLVRMSRHGDAASISTFAVAGSPKGLAVRDVNNDGKADLVIASNANNTVTIRLSK